MPEAVNGEPATLNPAAEAANVIDEIVPPPPPPPAIAAVTKAQLLVVWYWFQPQQLEPVGHQ